MIIDTHCHYNLSPLYESWSEHWAKAQEHGVGKAIIVGTEIETSRRALEIASQDESLMPAVGIHPNKYSPIPAEDLPTTISQHATALAMMLQDHPEIVAIGETGLDYYRLEKDDQVARDNQQAAFRAHIQLASEFNKVLIVHVRDKDEEAYWDALKILQENHQGEKPFILHCVSGPEKYLQQAAEMGAFFGVAGNITYPNAKDLRETVKNLPQDKIISETDAPFLAPQAYRGQKCEPYMIAKTVEQLTELGLDKDKLESNFQQLGI